MYHLFGKLSAQPDYVITEEDTLEFLHHMQSTSRMARADHLFDALRDNHLLFIGCTFPDWLSRFLLRIAKARQLSLRRKEMELLVGSLANRDRDLVLFLRHFSSRTKVASCPPAEFIRELAARYSQRPDSRDRATALARTESADETETETANRSMEPGAIFISYTHEDWAAARRLRDFLEEEAGIDVWLDTRRLEAGVDWDRMIRRNIKSCSYFMPLISSASARRPEGYYRQEWDWAAERARGFDPSIPFIIPVVIDDTSEQADGVHDRFRQSHGCGYLAASAPRRSVAA